MGETKVTEIVVHSDLQPTLEEHKANIIYTNGGGGRFDQELVDEGIQDEEVRSKLRANDGCISITVVPGIELGQVAINVQFEGKQGLHDLCLQNQGDLLEAASGWLAEVLAELGADFNVRFEAKPCHKTDKRLPLKRAAEILTGAFLGVQGRSEPKVLIKNRADHKVD